MSSPYPPIKRWVFADGIYTATLQGIRPAGLRGNESGAFWLGKRSAITMVNTVILPSGSGIEERPGQWHVSSEVFGIISWWAKPRGLTLLGIAHTHVRGVPVRLS